MSIVVHRPYLQLTSLICILHHMRRKFRPKFLILIIVTISEINVLIVIELIKTEISNKS